MAKLDGLDELSADLTLTDIYAQIKAVEAEVLTILVDAGLVEDVDQATVGASPSPSPAPAEPSGGPTPSGGSEPSPDPSPSPEETADPSSSAPPEASPEASLSESPSPTP